MNLDRKKIYIGIIIVCFILTAGILYYNFSGSGSSTPPAPAVVNPLTTSPTGSTATPANSGISTNATGDIIYSTPVVFPNDTKFDWTLIQADKYKTLTPDTGLTLDPSEVGRDDPFKPF